MSSNQIRAKYPCKQTELYAVTSTYIISVHEHAARFAAHNANYAPAQMAAVQTFFDSVKALPNFQQRNEPSETLRVLLRAQTDKCLNKWRALRTFIERAYPGALLKPKLEAAGWSYLPQASNYNWEECNELFESGKEFLDAHVAELMAPEVGMLANFLPDYNAEYNSFKTMFEQIPDSILDQRMLTNEKVIANNQLYDWLIRTGKDAAVIFSNPEEAAIRERFVFSNVLSIVSSSGPAKLKGKVTDADNNALEGVSVYIEDLDAEVFTDAEGNYDSGNIPSGTYKVKFNKAGYMQSESEITINTGVTKTWNVVLTAA